MVKLTEWKNKLHQYRWLILSAILGVIAFVACTPQTVEVPVKPANQVAETITDRAGWAAIPSPPGKEDTHDCFIFFTGESYADTECLEDTGFSRDDAIAIKHPTLPGMTTASAWVRVESLPQEDDICYIFFTGFEYTGIEC